MKKTGLYIMLLWVLGVSVSQASILLDFTQSGANSGSNVTTDVLSINTATPSDSSPGTLDNATAVSGSTTVGTTFTLTMEAGFGFQHDGTWTWDTTDYDDNAPNYENNRVNFADTGLNPTGDGGGFNDGEILWFTVGGLGANSLVINEYTLNGKNQDRVDFFYQLGLGDITKIDSSAPPADNGLETTSVGITFSDGDIFGWADNNGATGSRGQVYGFDFDIVPEPATIGMLGLGALITLLIRRVRPSYR